MYEAQPHKIDTQFVTCCCSVKMSRDSSKTRCSLPVRKVNTLTFLSLAITENNLPLGENVKLRGVVLHYQRVHVVYIYDTYTYYCTSMCIYRAEFASQHGKN